MEFAQKINYVRKKLGLTQEELAKKLGVVYATVNRWEQGSVRPHANMVRRFERLCQENDFTFSENNAQNLGYELITATQIENWFADNQRESQGKFPELIERLIKESLAGSPNEMRFPHGDKISSHGFDGYLKVSSVDNIYIPNGESFWEFGATVKSSAAKILDDYHKRDGKLSIEQKEISTFILVTPKSLSTQTIEKIKKAISGNSWKEVRIYTSIELSAWLSQNIATCSWMYENLCGITLSIETLGSAYEKLKNSTTPQLSTKLFTVSRDKEAEDLLNLIKTQKVIKVAGPSFFESYGFVVSAMIESHIEQTNLRTVICNDAESLIKFNEVTRDKILILNAQISNFNFVESKNTIILIYGKDVCDNVIDIHLNYRPQLDLKKVLIEDMKVSANKLVHISHLAKNNVFLIVRALENKAVHHSNDWWGKEGLDVLIPLLLVGKINVKSSFDKEILKYFLSDGVSIERYLSQVKRWENVDNSPIIVYGDYIKVCLKEELWSAVNRSISDQDIEKLINIVRTIFSAHNPKFELSSDRQYEYQLNNDMLQFYKYVVEGLLDSCILSSIYNGKQRDMDILFNEIFNAIRTKEQLFTVSEYMSLIAECSPECLTAYVEREIQKEDSVIWEIFNNRETNNNFLAESYYCNLLWALELLSRLDNYKIRACMILFQLVRKNYKYKLVNSPADTLETILWLYNNQNALSIEEKTRFLEQAILKYGRDFVPFAIRSVFKNSGILSNSSLKWRDPDLKDGVLTGKALGDSIDRVVGAILKSQNNVDINIVKLLIDKYPLMPQITFSNIISYVNRTYKEGTPESKELYEYFLNEKYKIVKYQNGKRKFVEECFDTIIKRLKPNDTLEAALVYFKSFEYDGCPIVEAINNDYGQEVISKWDARYTILADLFAKYDRHEVLDKIIQVVPNCADAGKFLAGIELENEEKKFVRDKLVECKKFCALSKFIFEDDEESKNAFFDSLDERTLSDFIPFIQNDPFIPDRIMRNDQFAQKFFSNRNLYELTSESELRLIQKYNPIAFLSWVLTDKKRSWDINEIVSVMDNVSESDLSIVGRYVIKKILLEIDSNYYNDEIVRLEFRFLKLFDREEMPNGILRYFIENPKEYCALINKEKNIPFEIIYEINSRLTIPKQFSNTQILQFVKSVIENCNGDSIEDQVKRQNLGELLAHSFAHEENAYIPIRLKCLLEEIADAEVNKGVILGYINSEGFRTVTDGSAEIELAARIEAEAKECEVLYPKSALILNQLANDQRRIAETDKLMDLIYSDIL